MFSFNHELTFLDIAFSTTMKKFINQASEKYFKLFWAGELLPLEEQKFNKWPKVLFCFEILLLFEKRADIKNILTKISCQILHCQFFICTVRVNKAFYEVLLGK